MFLFCFVSTTAHSFDTNKSDEQISLYYEPSIDEQMDAVDVQTEQPTSSNNLVLIDQGTGSEEFRVSDLETGDIDTDLEESLLDSPDSGSKSEDVEGAVVAKASDNLSGQVSGDRAPSTPDMPIQKSLGMPQTLPRRNVRNVIDAASAIITPTRSVRERGTPLNVQERNVTLVGDGFFDESIAVAGNEELRLEAGNQTMCQNIAQEEVEASSSESKNSAAETEVNPLHMRIQTPVNAVDSPKRSGRARSTIDYAALLTPSRKKKTPQVISIDNSVPQLSGIEPLAKDSRDGQGHEEQEIVPEISALEVTNLLNKTVTIGQSEAPTADTSSDDRRMSGIEPLAELSPVDGGSRDEIIVPALDADNDVVFSSINDGSRRMSGNEPMPKFLPAACASVVEEMELLLNKTEVGTVAAANDALPAENNENLDSSVAFGSVTEINGDGSTITQPTGGIVDDMETSLEEIPETQYIEEPVPDTNDDHSFGQGIANGRFQ